ncbi:MAG: DEAD/DEAH box helicase, partial [Blautia sp.]|nr:DEAD/DEAH box helicase [Blautia sp.]
YALEEFKGHREKLLTLLSCLNNASEVCPLIGKFVESGELFHALGLTAEEAFEILQAVPKIEEVGILCRVPNWWKRHSSAVQMQVSLGDDKPSMLGFNAILAMRPSLTVDGVELSEQEIRLLLTQTEGLAFLKGKWIEVDHQRLSDLLERMTQYHGEVSLLQALKMEAGLKAGKEVEIDVGPLLTNGKWLGELLYRLRQPAAVKSLPVPEGVHATLRPYQQTGYSWLKYMRDLGFGACLADDMGLGKTLQVLTFLRELYKEKPEAKVLLIVPTSLLGNWEKEAAKFTPDIPILLLHGGTPKLRDSLLEAGPAFLTITTYGMVARMSKLQDFEWDCLILDEAQAIKNPGTQQTRTIKKLKAEQKIAMTGTPIENELANLWSLFDFLNKGLLGTSNEFRDFAGKLELHPEGYEKLKNMVSPFILRRLKTDKNIIQDLPEKLEQLDYVSMSKKQVVLYRKQVAELEELLGAVEGMKRRGLVLSFITKLKQICNHPDQFLGQDTFAPEESGKFTMLRDICSTIYEKRERVLVFTQYREIIDYLSHYLESIFGRKGLVLHGGTPVNQRAKLVEQFNGEDYVPFMILSVRAGGTGLNLTKANHVIHFDRWWNPAVENQATDRAYRIGQEKNVMVHKLVCTGTIEEKIDAMINSKKDLAENVIGGGGENWITEMGDQDLLNLMRLDA